MDVDPQTIDCTAVTSLDYALLPSNEKDMLRNCARFRDKDLLRERFIAGTPDKLDHEETEQKTTESVYTSKIWYRRILLTLQELSTKQTTKRGSRTLRVATHECLEVFKYYEDQLRQQQQRDQTLRADTIQTSELRHLAELMANSKADFKQMTDRISVMDKVQCTNNRQFDQKLNKLVTLVEDAVPSLRKRTADDAFKQEDH